MLRAKNQEKRRVKMMRRFEEITSRRRWERTLPDPSSATLLRVNPRAAAASTSLESGSNHRLRPHLRPTES